MLYMSKVNVVQIQGCHFILCPLPPPSKKNRRRKTRTRPQAPNPETSEAEPQLEEYFRRVHAA